MLDNPLAPLLLADGTQINPSTGTVIKEKRERAQFVSIPSASEAQAIVARTRRSIAEMPFMPQQMNGVSLVIFYTLWGMSDNDIAVALNVTLTQVKTIKKLPQYGQLIADVQKNVLEAEATDIRSFFQQKAYDAANKIVDIMESDDGVLAFKASQDVLDRAGHRPVDTIVHKMQMENALRIEVIDKSKDNSIPTIDAEFEEVI